MLICQYVRSGAVVIMFQFDNGRQVLHTGDFRWVIVSFCLACLRYSLRDGAILKVLDFVHVHWLKLPTLAKNCKFADLIDFISGGMAI